MTRAAPEEPASVAMLPGVGPPLGEPVEPVRPAAETTRAVGLAAATIAANLVAVVITVVFTRLLGTGGYGSLAALINLTIILFVPGSALQVAAAREGALGRLGTGGELAGTLARWTRRLLGLLLAVTALSALAREPLAALLDIDEAWAAAAVPPTGVLWLLLSLQRGLLQSARAYRAVGASIVFEALGRLVVGVLLVAAGLEVTGAYLGTVASLALTAVVLAGILRRRLGAPAPDGRAHRLRALARGAAIPVAALTLVAALLNVDVIMAKHTLSEETAGIYAAATVAGKAVVWVAVGLGLYVLPETARQAAAGGDARRVLLRALAVVGVLAAVTLVIFASVPELLLRTAFGAEFEPGARVLLVLGMAFGLLSATYLAVQFQLGLHRRAFLAVLAAAAVLEPLLLLGADGLASFAAIALWVQAGVAAALLLLSARDARGAHPPAAPGPVATGLLPRS